MAQVLVILENQELIKVLQGGLSSRYGVDVIVKSSAIDAITMMEIVPFDLIICQNKIGKESTAFKICNYIQSNSGQIKVLTIGEKSSGLKNEVALTVKSEYREIIKTAVAQLGMESREPEEKVIPKIAEKPVAHHEAAVEEEDRQDKTTVFVLPKLSKPEEKAAPVQAYHSFHLKYFLHLPPNATLHFEVYTRVKKKDDYEYNLKISSGSQLTKEILHALQLRTGKELFVKAEDFTAANEFLSKGFLEKIAQPQLPYSERIKLNSDGYEILMDVFKNSSFNRYSVEIIKEMVKSIDLLMKLPDPLLQFNKAYSEKNMSYSYAHTHLTCQLIFMIIDKFVWSKDQSKNKIIYLSLFHDLCLHNERIIKLHHRFQEQKNLSEEDKQLMLNHADTAASMLESIVKAPKELTSLVREHHGLKNGKGFIDTLSISISSLSMAFIVCEDFSTRFLEVFDKQDKEPTQSQLEVLLTELKEKYLQLAYMEVANELPKLFKN